MKSWEQIAKGAKSALKKLEEEFEQYKKESIKWSVGDFTQLEVKGYSITEEQAQTALEEMIDNHDCTIGITWETLDYYVEEYGTKVEEGTELWRKYHEDENT